MPSGKQSKRRRKVRPPPPPVARRRQASPKVLIGAAAVVVLIAVAIVLAVVPTGGSSSDNSSTAVKLPDASEVQQTFAGVPQNGLVLGKPSAPVTMIEYVDLQCPFCQQFETTAMPTVITNLIRKGKLRVEARPIAIIGPDSL